MLGEVHKLQAGGLGQGVEGSGEEQPGGGAASPVSLERGRQPAELWGVQV